MSPTRALLFQRLRPWGLVAVACIAFGAGVRLGFASEDFLILSRFEGEAWWSVVASEFRGPWLGLEHVAFYRPVAMALVGLQHALWGLRPWAFHGAQVLLHGVNGVLVYLCARRLLGPWDRRLTTSVQPTRELPALLVAILFLLFPLHLGSVLFLGSYATMWGGFFQLLALRKFLGALEEPQREGGPRLLGPTASLRTDGFGVAAYLALALGCYEASAVFPMVLLLAALALAKDGMVRRRVGALLLPSLVVLGAYFVLRRAVLGVFVGGYDFMRQRWLGRLFELAMDAFASIPRLLLGQPEWLAAGPSALVGLGLCGLGAAALLRWRGGLARVWAFGLASALLFQLPFGFSAVVPATGRFWYLAAAGSALVLTVPATALAGLAVARVGTKATKGKLSEAFLLAMVLPVVAFYGLSLKGDLTYYRQADQEGRALLRALAAWEASEDGAASGPLLVGDPPAFVHNARPSPVAKVFQYGLTEAARPPFGTIRRSVIPLPSYVPRDRWPAVAEASGGQVRRWSSRERSLLPIETSAGPPGGIIAARRQGETVTFSCLPCGDLRLFIVTPDATYRGEPFTSSTGLVPLPMAFLRGMASLAGDTAYWWLEERGPGAALRRCSEIRPLDLSNL